MTTALARMAPRPLLLRGVLLNALRSRHARWGVPALGAVTAALLASWCQSALPPSYTATARIVVDPRSAGAASAAGPWIATQAQILESDRVAARAAADVGLGSASSEDSSDRLLGRPAVESAGPGGVLSVRYASHDPAFAAQVADAFVAAYERVSQELQEGALATVQERARAQVASLRNEVEQARLRVEAADPTGAREEPTLIKAVRLARLAPSTDWSGLPGERTGRSAPVSLLAGADQALPDAQSPLRPSIALVDPRSQLEQARQALSAAQARLVQFDNDRLMAPPPMTILNRARESISAPGIMARNLVWLAALCGLIAGWALRALVRRIDRRVLDAGELERETGIAVLGVLQSAEARSLRAPRPAVQDAFAPRGGVVPAIP